MYELPDHLASLNALAPSPPSTVLDQSAEEAVWNYLNTDALFSNFGATPAEWQEKHAAKEVQEARPTKETKSESAETPIAADLKSFIEQFAQKPDGNFNLFSFLPNDASASTTINTSDILPSSSKGSEATSPDDGRPSGAKKLKQLGADVAEIEEDKRRRNTEASARFRAKKKEREQALERRATELEVQVAQLTTDKSLLENENRLLKALVLGGARASGQDATDALEHLIGKRKRALQSE